MLWAFCRRLVPVWPKDEFDKPGLKAFVLLLSSCQTSRLLFLQVLVNTFILLIKSVKVVTPAKKKKKKFFCECTLSGLES